MSLLSSIRVAPDFKGYRIHLVYYRLGVSGTPPSSSAGMATQIDI